MMKPMFSTVSLQTLAISPTNLWTIGFPAIGINGLGTVNVCGRILLPIPAIGIIMFIFIEFLIA
jgi:hypothetical protein